MIRMGVSSLVAAIVAVPLIVVADGNYYVLLAAGALILAVMATLGADDFLDRKPPT